MNFEIFSREFRQYWNGLSDKGAIPLTRAETREHGEMLTELDLEFSHMTNVNGTCTKRSLDISHSHSHSLSHIPMIETSNKF